MKLALAALALLAYSGCSIPKMVEPSGYETFSRENFVLGPEAFEFCDGWVEFWGQVDASQKFSFYLKATPPAGKTWAVWNQDVILEHPHLANKRLQMGDIKVLDVGAGVNPKNATVVVWDIDLQGLNPEAGIEVSLRQFEGCTDKDPLKGVVLSPSF